MKKILRIFFLFAISLSFCLCAFGCDGLTNNNKKDINQSQEQQQEQQEQQEQQQEQQEQQEVYYSVMFDSDGGTIVESMRVKKNEKINPPANPTKINSLIECVFVGWFNGNSRWNFETDMVTRDLELVAHWEVVGEYSENFLPS